MNKTPISLCHGIKLESFFWQKCLLTTIVFNFWFIKVNCMFFLLMGVISICTITTCTWLAGKNWLANSEKDCRTSHNLTPTEWGESHSWRMFESLQSKRSFFLNLSIVDIIFKIINGNHLISSKLKKMPCR